MDTAGAWLIQRLVNTNEARGVEIRLQGQSETAATLLNAVGEAVRRAGEAQAIPRPNIIIRALELIGMRVYEMRDDFLAGMNILGATIRGAQMKLGAATPSTRPRSSTSSTAWASAPFRWCC